MKALIISDSHGLIDELTELKIRHKDADVFIHCGDSELDFGHEALDGFQYVRGNCDFDSRFPKSISKEMLGYRFFVTHGHLYNVKMTLMNLSYQAEEEQAEIVCFGHSHIAGSEMIGGRLFINPGSIRLPKGIRDKTYVLLDMQSRHVTVQFYSMDGNLIKNLSRTYHFE
ncbi:metallophosphoesterase [Peribacillus deserti]|uniref:Phosphoesterase n=1 Tax=Peribacillus deserti TaxID=673318 RepID=A0A2N5M769_9BACI|nr:metallophosphoesterase [Peribacillus deserti]PLT30200.1 YfcE family phosphodiesterase [Peribacillus deserti]